ncbi:MAG TPA: ribonuclease E inhibitor RraB [Opitutaceae bacterium]
MDPIPDDENGDVLRRMREGGDSLTKPRIIDYNFVFPDRDQSIEFARAIPERDLEVCLSFYEERDLWQVIVKKHMVPEHRAISHLEAELTRRAERAGGEADGWGCMRITE